MKLKGNLSTKIFFSFTAVILFFSITEIIISITGLDKLVLIPRIFRQFNNIPIEFFINKGTYLRDNLLFWKLSPRHPDVNMQGFRENRLFAIPKPKGTFRILCIGDSVIFGYGTKREETYPKVLERLLKERLNKRIEIINAGVPGYSSLQGLRYFKRDLLTYGPDLITVHFGPDDSTPAVCFSDKEQPIQCALVAKLQDVLSKSKTYQFLNRIILCLKYINKERNSGNLYKPRVSYEDYIENLKSFAKLGEQYHFKTIFITPLLYEKKNIIPIYNLPEDGLQVDLYKIFKEKEDETKDLFIDNCHLTPKGHQLVAQAIADVITKEAFNQ